MLSRKSTDPELTRARDAQRTPTFPTVRNPGRVQDTFTAYDSFGWDQIKEYLRTKWPNLTNWDFKPTRSDNKWSFEVPERLTEDDKRELRKRRDAPKRTRGRSDSPEPAQAATSASSS